VVVVGGVACTATTDHFRYPTGRDDYVEYRQRMTAVRPGVTEAAFLDLWRDDGTGYRILGVDDQDSIQVYVVGFDIEYLDAQGSSVDDERRIVDTTPAGREAERRRFEARSVDFWTESHWTDLVAVRDGVVVEVRAHDR
jgi:hypothetical protein